MAARDAYAVDYNTYTLAEYADLDADAHSRDRGCLGRGEAVDANAAAALLVHSTCKVQPKGAMAGRAARPALEMRSLSHLHARLERSK